MRDESDDRERAEAMDMAADRHAEEVERLEAELAKADRRTSEQEAIMAKQRKTIERLREGLTEALSGWAAAVAELEVPNREAEARIAELRRLTEPRGSTAAATAHESDCAIFGRSEGMDNRTVLNECTCPRGDL